MRRFYCLVYWIITLLVGFLFFVFSGHQSFSQDVKNIPWWKKEAIYQIYPRSFFDTDGNGTGDLPGITQKLEYIKGLGFGAIWISPFFESPQQDFGYDISNFYAIAPEYGTMKDCEALIQKAHELGLKVIFDLVMNHTSDQHDWFRESRSDTSNPKRDWYIWRKGRGKKGNRPPTNWKSMIGGNGWHRDSITGEWYWATFLPFQPDLNYRNPEVKEAMFKVVRFWIEKGVDGFRLDIFNAIFEDARFRNNPASLRAVPSEKNTSGFFQNPKHTLNQPESIALAEDLRALLDEYKNRELMTVGEVFGPREVVRSYCGDSADGLHLVFQFETLRTPFTARRFKKLIRHFEADYAEPYHPVWVFGNHDQMRSRTRLGGDLRKSKLLAMFQLTLRGTPFVYYGEEIGMEQARIPVKSALDPLAKKYRWVPSFLVRWANASLNRDECRTPMQWNDQENAGFTAPDSEPWLPIHENSPLVNVETESTDSTSLLMYYKGLLEIRNNTSALNHGIISIPEIKNSSAKILFYDRMNGQGNTVRVLLNFSRRIQKVRRGSVGGKIVLSTCSNFPEMTSKWVKLRPYEGVLIRQ